MAILGLDASTTSIGYTVFNYDGSINYIGVLLLNKNSNLIEKATDFKHLLLRLKATTKESISHVYIESPLIHTMKNRNTTAILLKFHGIGNIVWISRTLI